jgi:hypothetical protein
MSEAMILEDRNNNKTRIIAINFLLSFIVAVLPPKVKSRNAIAITGVITVFQSSPQSSSLGRTAHWLPAVIRFFASFYLF